MTDMTTIPSQVLGWLVCGAINHALSIEDSDEDPMCCPEYCGPCAGMKWLRDNDPEAASAAVTEATGTGWDWQNEAGGIAWHLLEEAWARRDCEAMHEDETGVPKVGDMVWLPDRFKDFNGVTEIAAEPGKVVSIVPDEAAEGGYWAMVDRGQWGQFGCTLTDLRLAETEDPPKQAGSDCACVEAYAETPGA
jgi:hypothetical protein